MGFRTLVSQTQDLNFLLKALKILLVVVLLSGIGYVGWQVSQRLDAVSQTKPERQKERPVVPVEVAPIVIQPIQLNRQFTGTLDASAEFFVASKSNGRIEEMFSDLGDPVERGQLVAKLDNAELVQMLNQVNADLAVARANFTEAQSQLEIAERELERVTKLRERGVSSESESDAANATHLARSAHLDVTRAQVQRAEAELESARIRLGYSDVRANWRGGSNLRSVAERYVDEGETITANQPLLKIVELDTLIGVLSVTERDYGKLTVGQAVTLETDAFPGEEFTGNISRISPVFDESVRQARVEVTVQNPAHQLKPGMFIRASVELDRDDQAVTVPELALVNRNDETGVFLLVENGGKVVWKAVKPGIRQSQQVQLVGANFEGSVVVLGQQLLDDGSMVKVIDGSQQ